MRRRQIRSEAIASAVVKNGGIPPHRPAPNGQGRFDMTGQTHALRPSGTADSPLERRISTLDVPRIEASLDADGYAPMGPVLSASECAEIVRGYEDEAAFRKRIVMEHHGFGRGEYKYFAYPLPAVVAALRRSLYPPLARIANRWNETLNGNGDYPSDHEAYLKRCHAAGQCKPTPLVLKYGAGDYNRLHQDLYGDLVFPLQVVFLLSASETDFTGGELVLTEQRPRMQSRASVVPLAQGEGVIFAVNQRPARGSRGFYRVVMRHGVSRVHMGSRLTLGIIFHDAA
jgi:hypothetical protein